MNRLIWIHVVCKCKYFHFGAERLKQTILNRIKNATLVLSKISQLISHADVYQFDFFIFWDLTLIFPDNSDS